MTAIRSSSGRMQELVNSMVDAAMARRAELTAHLSPINLHQVAARVVTVHVPLLPPQVDLVLDVPKDLPPFLADPQTIEHILHNLVANSVEARSRSRSPLCRRRWGLPSAGCSSGMLPAELTLSILRCYRNGGTSLLRADVGVRRGSDQRPRGAVAGGPQL